MHTLNRLSKFGNKHIEKIPKEYIEGLRLGASSLPTTATGALTTKNFFDGLNKDKEKGWGNRILHGTIDGGATLAGSKGSREVYRKLTRGMGGDEVIHDLGEGVAALAGGDLALRGARKGLDRIKEKTAAKFEVVGDEQKAQRAARKLLAGEEIDEEDYTDHVDDSFGDIVRMAVPASMITGQLYSDEGNMYQSAARGIFDGAAAYAGGGLGKSLSNEYTDNPLYKNISMVAGTVGGGELSRRFVRPAIEKGYNKSMNKIKELYNESKEASIGQKAGVGAGTMAAGYNMYDSAKNFDKNDPKKSLKRTGINLAGTAAGGIAGGIIGRNISGGNQGATKAGVGIGSLIGATQTAKQQDKFDPSKQKNQNNSNLPDFNPK